MTRPRRKPGEGGIGAYDTRAGKRWMIRYDIKDPVTAERIQKIKRGFPNERAALKSLREHMVQTSKPGFVEPSRMLTGDYLDAWLLGLRLAPSTVASYKKNVRLHIKPRLGHLPLPALTGTGLTALYRELETNGRRDGTAGGLSPRTVRYVHAIIRAALRDAVNDDLLPINPADKAKPPTTKQAAPPEMQVWDATQLKTFLDRPDDLRPAWLLLAMTGMRRGEALALRWADIDFAARTLSVRRSVTLIKDHGCLQRLHVGPPKSGKSRVIDLDHDTLAVLKSYRVARAEIGLQLAGDGGVVFGTVEGDLRNPEHFSREWNRRLERHDDLPKIRLHDLRHTHATLLLKAGTPIKVVSERLGHASVQITLQVYQHVLPGMQRDAAHTLADLVFRAGPAAATAES